jgi:hypothetical protein
MTKRNLKRDSTLPNNVWDALLHELDNNFSLFPDKTPFVPGHRDPTVPVTQCNGLCHVTAVDSDMGYAFGMDKGLLVSPRQDQLNNQRDDRSHICKRRRTRMH